MPKLNYVLMVYIGFLACTYGLHWFCLYLWSTLVFLLVLMVYIGFACTYGLHWFSCLYLWSTLVLLVLMVYIGFLACLCFAYDLCLCFAYGLHWFSCLFVILD